ncbi:NADH-quinone oxidoreductase subunit A [Candidatus Thorarchaeota archaeon]|nr:NADH-quinone oxidoreductase subunit A [Candidatus Thorarchaeota archaeon]TFH00138.1 MAG: NADH-quinone oxidoreductase subunit A [Candidatus Thorarchaeota archaeon]
MRLFLDFIPVIIWALLGVVLVVVMLLASWVLRPHVLQNSEKTSSYECGEEPIGPARISYPYNYFVYTVLFVVVDVMGAFLWLLSSSTLLWDDTLVKYSLVWEVILFIAIVMGGIAFVMKMLPQSALDGKETLEQYRKAKAERAQEKALSGRH